MAIHPGWVSVLEDKRLQIRVWKDLAVVWIARLLRMTRSARRKHEMRWLDLRCATLYADPLRQIAQGDRVMPDYEGRSSDVWVYSGISIQEAIDELHGLAGLLERAGIPTPQPSEAFRDVTGLVKEAMSRGLADPTMLALTPRREWRYALAVRQDFMIWLDELHYAYEIRSLCVAEKAWKRAQSRHRWLRLLRVAKGTS